jgi:hypothetical protein
MRKIQKIVISVYCLLVAVACIYVPWASEGVIIDYHFFWRRYCVVKVTNSWGISETKKVYDLASLKLFIDYRVVVLELIALTAIFVILFILTLRPKKVLPGS